MMYSLDHCPLSCYSPIKITTSLDILPRGKGAQLSYIPCFPAAHIPYFPDSNEIFIAMATDLIYSLYKQNRTPNSKPLRQVPKTNGGIMPSPKAYRRLFSVIYFSSVYV